jgi:hypothetical protein
MIANQVLLWIPGYQMRPEPGNPGLRLSGLPTEMLTPRLLELSFDNINGE